MEEITVQFINGTRKTKKLLGKYVEMPLSGVVASLLQSGIWMTEDGVSKHYPPSSIHHFEFESEFENE